MQVHRRLLLLSLFCVLPTGCDTVRWLPDSTGVIFPEKNGRRLVRFDFASKKRTVLLSDEKIKSIWPGISADGKKFAVGEMTVSTKQGSKERTKKLRIHVYSMDGTKLSSGKVHERKDQLDMEAQRTDVIVEDVFIDWSGPPDKLLLLWEPVFGIYDLKNDTIQQLEAAPLFVLNSPVRPDRKGFLASTGDEDKPNLTLFDWEGKGKKLFDFSKVKDNKGPSFATWSKSTWRVTTPTRITTFDIDKGTKRSELHTIKPQSDNQKIKWIYVFPGGEAFLCRIEDDRANHSLELHQPKNKRVKSVTKPGEHRINDLQLFPSPDGKFMALSCQDNKGNNCILIVDDSGNIRHNIAPEK